MSRAPMRGSRLRIGRSSGSVSAFTPFQIERTTLLS